VIQKRLIKIYWVKIFTDKVVVVTGAGGSTGSELCKEIVFLRPKALILYEMSELALYTIENELYNIAMYSLDIYPILGSVNNKDRLSNVLKHKENNLTGLSPN
jgi:FlaA1/EpsC-like NDP-sugar epimerase